ncbi:condensation domain-containing protein, partial [Actinosynnema sp. NPDC023658]|uniref:condensation domain-containing protein n=1 Tax=Actinosynnema sp. NPDC023658 TaxID=3155465 RepID=UPI003410AB4A
MNGEPTARLPLTAAQAGIWFAQSLDPTNPVYAVAEQVDIDGPLDTALFARALRLVVAEAEALRIAVVEGESGSQQLVRSEVDVPVEVVDLASGADADAWTARRLARPIGARGDDLVEFALLRLGEQRHRWFARYHHVVLDGAGTALVERRVAEVYTALARGLDAGPNPFGPVTGLL